MAGVHNQDVESSDKPESTRKKSPSLNSRFQNLSLSDKKKKVQRDSKNATSGFQRDTSKRNVYSPFSNMKSSSRNSPSQNFNDRVYYGKGWRLSSSDPSGEALCFRKSTSGDPLKGPRCSSSSSQSSETARLNAQSRGRRHSDSVPEKGYLLPYGLRAQHAAHKCSWSGSETASTMSQQAYGSRQSGNVKKSSDRASAGAASCSSEGRKDTRSRTTSSTPTSKKGKSKFGRKDFQFEAYMPLCEVQQGLKRGELIEGILRINPRNYEDAYISAPDDLMDIYVGGILDRNRALNGDVVVVKLKPPEEWKILQDVIEEYEKKCSCSAQDTTSFPCTENNITPSIDDSNSHSSWNQIGIERPSDTLEIVGLDTFLQQVQEVSKENKRKRTRRRKKKGQKEDLISTKVPLELANVVSDISNNSSPHQVENTHIYDNNNPGADTHSSEDKSVSHCQNDTELESENSNWTSGIGSSSSTLLVSPEELLNFEDDGPLEGLHVASCDDNSDTCNANATVVTLEDLSEEFTDSYSGGSECSQDLDQILEDAAFYASIQDAKNNNTNEAEMEFLYNSDDDNNDSNESVQDNAESDHHSPAEAEENKLLPLDNEKLSDKDHFSSGCKSFPLIENPSVNNEPSNNSVFSTFKSDDTTHWTTWNEEDSIFDKDTKTSTNTSLEENEEKNLSQKKNQENNSSHSNNANLSKDSNISSLGKQQKLSIQDILNHPQSKIFLQKTAKVVYIIERKHSRASAGHLKLFNDDNKNFALFSPNDHRIPRIMIPMVCCPPGFMENPQHFENTLFLARITDWPDHSKFAKGLLARSLGEAGEIEPESDGFLLENDIDFSEFPDEALKDLPLSNWKISPEELYSRRDFRSQVVFTIDPSTARDMDDAVSCELLDSGIFEVGVHIADVSYFVKENTPLDNIAKDRATSVYLVQKVVPMLPPILCEQLCSLNPGVDRLTFSVVWHMTQDAQIIDEWFGRSVINSCVKLSYENAQDMIENPSKEWKLNELPQLHGKFSIHDIVNRVLSLHNLAVKLRKTRADNGALRLDQIKVHFTLDSQSGLPSGFSVHQQRESNRLIEEFMLLANMAVARKIQKSFPKLALLRRHPGPNQKVLNDVISLCGSFGITIDGSSSGALQESLRAYGGSDLFSSTRELILTHLLAKSMNLALYFCVACVDDPMDYQHYALSVPLYTHFTSPIRRYPDILVHRQLVAAVYNTNSPSYTPKELHRWANHCNDKKLASKRVQEESSELFLSVFIRECGPLEEQAVVCGVMDHSFDVLLLRMGIIKRIYCNKLGTTHAIHEEIEGVSRLTLIWKKGRKEFRQIIMLFSLVCAVLSSVPNERLKFNAVLKAPLDDQYMEAN